MRTTPQKKKIFIISGKNRKSNPAKGIKKFDEAKRERWLTVEELQKFREELDKYKDESAANVLRLLLLTGSRASEALKARWEEFDLHRGVWTKPSHHTKQKKVEHIPLSYPSIEAARAHRADRLNLSAVPRAESAKARAVNAQAARSRVSLSADRSQPAVSLRWLRSISSTAIATTVMEVL